MEPLPQLPGIQGLIVSICTMLITVGGSGYFIIKKLRNEYEASAKKSNEKAESEAEKAEKRVMDAMQTELSIVRGSLDSVRKENTRLQQTIHTIISAMRARGLHVTILGEMIDIQDSKGGSTTTRISGIIHTEQEE